MGKADNENLPDPDNKEESLPPSQNEETPPQKPADSKPSSNEPPKGYVTEESYQGLQRVVAKKDKELEDLRSKMNTLAESLEELKTNSSQLAGTKGDLEKALQEAKTQLESIETDRNTLDKQLRQQGIVMREFPNLAGVAQYIPQAEDDDTYRANAKAFSEAMGSFVKSGVHQVISGGTPPQPPSKDTASETEEDQLWRDIYSLAGVPGKEKEFNDANERLQQVLAAKTTK